MLHQRTVRALSAAALILVAAAPLLSQTATSTLSGVVHDESAAIVSGVTVTARSLETGATRHTTTDESGRYSIVGLAPGEYEVRAELTGFATVVRSGVVLTVAGQAVQDVTLALSQRSEEVTVQVQEPLVEVTHTDLSRVVGEREIESLPNIGRNFVDFVKLSSGVAIGRENIGGGPFKEPDTGVGAAAAPRLSFGGQQELNTLVQVDGVDNIQTYTGLPRATPSQEAVKEFRILNSTYLAEYGRALGGFVNIVTKSGTNEMRGSAYYYGMNDALASRSILNQPEADELSQHQYGGTLGGPLVKDRTFFFVNYEGQQRSESNRFSQVILDNLAAINAVRSRFNLRPETVDQLKTNDYNAFLVKLDHEASEKLHLSGRYSFLDSEALNFPGGGGRASPASTAARDNATRDHAAVVNARITFSPSVLNETRVQWASRSYDYQPIVAEPTLEITNLIIMGKTTSDMDFYKESRWQGSSNMVFLSGGHQVKVGVDYNSIQDEAGWNLFLPARIIFPNMNAFLSFTPVVFWWPVLVGAPRPSFPVPFTDPLPPQWPDEATRFDLDYSSIGAFVQDQWRVNPKLTLNYGVRYDLESYPDRFVTKRDTNNFQPRVGIAYAYRPDGVVRVGFGIFHDRLVSSVGQVFTATDWSSRGDSPNAPLLFPNVARIAGRFRQTTVAGPGAPAAAVTFLTTGQVPASGATSLTDNMSSELVNPFSYQGSVQIAQDVGGGFAVSASYLFVKGRDLPGHGANLNAVRTGTLSTGKPIIAGRQFAELGNFHVTDNIGYSNYHGGTLELRKQFRGSIGFTASYTLAQAETNVESVTNLGDFPDGPDMSQEDGFSRQHVRHRGTLSFVSQVPKDVPVLGDFKFAALATVESGRLFTEFVGADANGDGNPNADRVGLLPRNSLEGPGYRSLDLRVAREFPLGARVRGEISVDVFNVFNHTNIRDLNTVWGSFDPNVPPIASFDTPRDVFNPRQAQIGLKVRF